MTFLGHYVHPKRKTPKPYTCTRVRIKNFLAHKDTVCRVEAVIAEKVSQTRLSFFSDNMYLDKGTTGRLGADRRHPRQPKNSFKKRSASQKISRQKQKTTPWIRGNDRRTGGHARIVQKALQDFAYDWPCRVFERDATQHPSPCCIFQCYAT